MNFKTYKCDGCGAVKKEANHWFVVRIEPHPVHLLPTVAGLAGIRETTGFLIFPWTDELANSRNSFHYCGSACLQKKQGEFVK